MAKDSGDKTVIINKPRHGAHNGMFGGAYFLFFIGAAVYYIQQADTFWMGVLGFLKAIVWPALLIYKLFTMLQM